MNVKKLIMGVLVCAAATASAEVKVVEITARQRYPWNGKVDIDYTIAAEDGDSDIYVTPYAYDADRGWTLFPTAFSGEGVGETVKPGRHRMVFDAKADLGTYKSSAFSINMIAGKHLAPYIVIDLSGGTGASSYPIRPSLVGPDLSDDTCRTTELWMRLIPPGTFYMGSPANELGRNWNEDYHKVTLTKPFYIGVFEVTQSQYQLVMGSNPAGYRGARFPVERMRGREIRENTNPTSSATVGDASFVGLLRKRTQDTVFPEIGGTSFDLPTEAQWEYACRLGTVTALNSGKNLLDSVKCENLYKVARYAENRNGGDYAIVGSYLPNAWGLFDMHGNVAELCRDYYVDSLGGGDVVDPGRNGSRFWVGRGGRYYDEANKCRSSSRVNVDTGDIIASTGFRLCCSVKLQ